MQQLAASSQTRFCSEVPVACLPANYRKHLPRQAKFCYVEEPIWDEANACYFFRIGTIPQFLAKSRSLRLSSEEADRICQSLDHPEVEVRPIYAAPSHLLPESLSDLECSHSYDLSDELTQAMLSQSLTRPPTPIDDSTVSFEDVPEDYSLPCCLYDYWFVAPTGITDNEGRCMVSVARLAHRLSGCLSGPVYTLWLEAAVLEQAMPVDEVFDRLDCHERRVQVNRHALECGAIPLCEEPEPKPIAETAIVTGTLEEEYRIVPLKDPIFLRKEDVIASNSGSAADGTILDAETILSNAIASVEREQTWLARQSKRDLREMERLDILRTCLEETLHWHSHLPRQKRSEPLLSLFPATSDEPLQGCNQREMCVQLVIGVPTTLPLPWHRIADYFWWPHPLRLESVQRRQSSSPPTARRKSAGAGMVA